MIADVQDILDVDRPSASDAAQRLIAQAFSKSAKPPKSAKATTRAAKPAGMARELYNLIKTDETTQQQLQSIIPTVSPTKLYGFHTPKAQLGRRAARNWRWRPFVNQARIDGLRLSHWVRDDAAADTGDYPFAKFNRTLRTVKYTTEDYDAKLKDPVWTRAASDHLVALVEQFAARWPVIASRFDRDRFGAPIKSDVESLKDRYYAMCNAMATSADQHIAYDADHNRRRRQQAENLWRRTHADVAEERELQVQLKKIEARKKERERKREDLQKIIAAAERAPTSPAPAALAAAAALMRTTQGGSNAERKGSRLPGQKGGWAQLAQV